MTMHGAPRGSRAWIARKLHFASVVATRFFGILTEATPMPRYRMAPVFLRIQARRVLCWMTGRPRTREEFLGLRMEFASYPVFALLFDEIFVDHDYWFTTNAPSPRIIDCGGHFGMSVAFFKQLYPTARITVFEPARSVFPILSRNVTANGFADVELRNQAVSGTPGMVRFFMDGQVLGSMHAVRGDGVDAVVDEVEAVCLSEYIDGEIDFLKMDIEGAEGDVLAEVAASGKLRLVKRMVIEYHHHLDVADDSFSRLLQLLESEGFGYQLKTSDRVLPAERTFQDVLIACYR